MKIKHIFFRLLFLTISYIPFGMLMFIGKPEKLQGFLFDIENFFGLKTFTITIFIGACFIIGIEAMVLLIKKKKAKYISNFFLLLFFAALYFYSKQNNIFYKKEKVKHTNVKHTTLIVATEGNIYNFNLDLNKIGWEYKSELDNLENRNSFVVNEQNIFMPFESGSLINFDVNTGKIIWKKQVYGKDTETMDIAIDKDGNEIINVHGLTPLFMSKPLVDKQRIVIASHGQPERTIPFLYSFDRKTGEMNWHEPLPSYFNYFAPVKYKGNKYDYYFVNSAVFLEKYGANSGSRISYGMFDGDDNIERKSTQKLPKNQFEKPIYTQMQADGRNIFIGDEKGKIFCLPLDEDAYVLEDKIITGADNTFIKNPSVFKWVFSDEDFTFQKNGITFLEDGVLYTVIENGTANKSAIFAINTSDGKLKWKKVIKDDIFKWALIEDKIIGSTENLIFYIDVTGKNYNEINISNRPLSNIELLDKDSFIYITRKGIEVLNIRTKEAKVIFKKQFYNRQHNNAQIKLILKKQIS